MPTDLESFPGMFILRKSLTQHSDKKEGNALCLEMRNGFQFSFNTVPISLVYKTRH